jgi:hypothetical protein
MKKYTYIRFSMYTDGAVDRWAKKLEPFGIVVTGDPTVPEDEDDIKLGMHGHFITQGVPTQEELDEMIGDVHS